MHFTIPAQEVVDFSYKELPAAGFEVTSEKTDAVPGGQVVIEFTVADGIPGRIFVSDGAWSESQININLFRSCTA